MSTRDSSKRGKRIEAPRFEVVRRRVPALLAMTVVLALGGVTGYVVAAPQDQGDQVSGPSGTSGAANLGPVTIFPKQVETFSLQYKVIDGSQSNASGSILISGPGVTVRASGIRRTYANGCPGAKNSSQLKIVACGFTHDTEYPSLYVLNARIQSSSSLRGSPAALGAATLRTVRLKVTGPTIASSGYDPDCLGNIDPGTGGCTTTPSSTTSTTTGTSTTSTS
jgi:hypothetical protein